MQTLLGDLTHTPLTHLLVRVCHVTPNLHRMQLRSDPAAELIGFKQHKFSTKHAARDGKLGTETKQCIRFTFKIKRQTLL